MRYRTIVADPPWPATRYMITVATEPWIARAETPSTELLARQMVELERKAKAARHHVPNGSLLSTPASRRLWRQRDDVRHERSLLLRQLWRFSQSPHAV